MREVAALAVSYLKTMIMREMYAYRQVLELWIEIHVYAEW